MKNTPNGKKTSRAWRNQRGFTLTEVLIAIVILLVGIVAVAQLVPASIGSNSANRNDSSALVFAQRAMDQFLSQPLTGTSFIYSIDAQTFPCNLGDPAQPNIVVGSPVVVFYNQLVIDFSAVPAPNYSFVYQDPNDPFGVAYDVRWAIVTTKNANNMVASKRFILGVRKQGYLIAGGGGKRAAGNGIYRPVTLDTILAK
jgi:prepilin-type N-terminal cleavage/methylation domain-containing protein